MAPAAGFRPAATYLPALTLSRSGLDRAAARRSDPHLVSGLLADPTTRVLLIADGCARVGQSSGPSQLVLRSPVPDDADRLGVFVGTDQSGAAYLAVVGDPAPGEPGTADRDGFRSLREVGVDLDDRDAGLFTTALALANWHSSHPFCPRCGAATVPAQAGWTRRCPRDGSEHYPRTDPAVIMSVVDDRDRLLLARGPQWTVRRYSVLAGFVEPGETLAAAVAREVHEEVGVHVADVRYVGDQPWPFPSSLMVGFTARALDTELVLQDGEIAEARWVTRAELRRELDDGSAGIAARLSIARALIEQWYGEPITAVP